MIFLKNEDYSCLWAVPSSNRHAATMIQGVESYEKEKFVPKSNTKLDNKRISSARSYCHY